MTVFDIEENQGTWFDLEAGGRIKLKTLTIEDFKKIEKQTTKKSVEYKRVDGKAERFVCDDVNEDLRNELTWDTCIMEWENFYDKNEKPIPCTRENKILLMNRSMKFLEFVNQCLEQLRNDEKTQTEAEEKN